MDDPQPPRRKFLKQAGLGALAAPVLSRLLAARRGFAEELAAVAAEPAAALPDRLRDAYGLDPRVTYLNHASIGTVPRPVQEAHRRYLEICESNPWAHMWGPEWVEPRAEVRRRAADLLGCDAEEVAFPHNTTEAFNLLAHGLPLGSGDEVLFSSLNHTGASACWFHMSEARGFAVRRFDFPLREVPGLSAGDVVDIYTEQIRPETRVLVLPHVDNTVGLRHPVARLTAAARSRGVRFVAVDGAQTAGMLPLDVAATGVDVYATSPHKWLQSPKGLGLLYVRRELFDQLRPMWVTWGQEDFRGSARIYEDYGTRNLPELLALGDAIDFQQRLGPEAKEAHHRALWEHARAAVDAGRGLTWRSPRAWELSAALWAVEVSGASSRERFETLYRDHGFVFRPFELGDLETVRISPNVANTARQVDRLLELLGEGVGAGPSRAGGA